MIRDGSHSPEIKTVTITIRELFSLQLCAAHLSIVNSQHKRYRCWCHMSVQESAPLKYNNFHTPLCHDLQRIMKSYDASVHPADEGQ
jgi:hypothetical protein